MKQTTNMITGRGKKTLLAFLAVTIVLFAAIMGGGEVRVVNDLDVSVTWGR